MYKCKLCDKEFEKRHAYIGHCRVHSGYVRPKNINSRRNKPHKTVCQFCGESFNDGRKLGGHMTHCTLNPNHLIIKKKYVKSRVRQKFSLV